jgi:DNA anti-recombination protein RmuC
LRKIQVYNQKGDSSIGSIATVPFLLSYHFIDNAQPRIALDSLKKKFILNSWNLDLSNLREYSKEELFALFREFLEEYYKQKEKELYEVSLIERTIRVEEELKNLRKEMEYLRKEMDYRFEALLREMNARFEALLAEQRALREEMNARFEAITKEMNARFEVITKEMNTRFEVQKRESDARFEAIIREMNARFESQKRESDARFEALEKRFNLLQWTMMLGFTILSILITVFSFLFRS